MKFGRNLSRNVVPEWASNYIKYKALKKLIKSAAAAVKEGQDPDLAGKILHRRSFCCVRARLAYFLVVPHLRPRWCF